MSWYRTGTVTVTNGSRNVTGAGTAWFSIITGGWGFRGPDGRVYEIESVSSDAAMLLAENYLGTTAAGQAYAAYPTQALTRTLTQRVSDLITTFTGFLTTRLAGLFAAGSAATPGLAREGDANTGVFWPADDAVAVSVGGVEAWRVTPAQNFGLGIPAPVVKFDMGSSGGGRFRVDTSNPAETIATSSNFAGSAFSTLILDAATHVLRIGGTEAMRVDSSRNAGLGTATPAARLHIFTPTDNIEYFRAGTSAEDRGLRMRSFAVSGGNGCGHDINAPGSGGALGTLTLSTNGAERIRLTADGNAGIGTASPAARLHIDSTTSGSGLIVGQLAQTSSQVNIGIGYRTAGLPFIGTNASSNPLEIGTRSATAVVFVSADTERMRIDAAGNWILRNPPSTPAALTANGDLTITPTSNGNVRISYRGSDGVTRTGNIALT